MAILTLDPNLLYQVNLSSTRFNEQAWSVLGLGPDGVSRALAVILEEFLRPLNSAEEHFLEVELDRARKQLSGLSSMDVKPVATVATIDELEDEIAQLEFALSRAEFITEVVSSPLSELAAGNFYGDMKEEGVSELFTPGAPHNILHLLYGYASALPFMRFTLTSPTIYR